MSSKRQSKSRSQIDQKTLQYKQFDEENTKKLATQQQMQKRKIVSVAISKKKGQQQKSKNQVSDKIRQNANKSQQRDLKTDQQTKKDSQSYLFKDLIRQKNKQGVGLFSSNQSLFANLKQQQTKPKSSIFDSNQKVNLFSFKTQNQNNSQQPEQDKKDQQNQVQADSQQLQKEQNLQVNKTKSKSNYIYKEACKSLFCKTVKKAKIDKGNLMQNMQICLQQDLNSKINVLRVRTGVSKVISFQGLILKKSSLNNLKGNTNNVQVNLFKISSKQKQHKIQKHILKIMFQCESDCQSFKKIFQNILNESSQKLQKQQTSIKNDLKQFDKQKNDSQSVNLNQKLSNEK